MELRRGRGSEYDPGWIFQLVSNALVKKLTSSGFGLSKGKNVIPLPFSKFTSENNTNYSFRWLCWEEKGGNKRGE